MNDDPDRIPDVPDDFEDPLENYEPRTYEDPLEKALAEESVAAIQATPYASVSADTTVKEAVETLAGLQVACLLVTEDDAMVGVFSYRDVLDKVALEYDEITNRPVREVMTKDPVYVYDSDSSAAALSVMAVCGFRHVPVLNVEQSILGIVSPHRVTEFLHQYFE